MSRTIKIPLRTPIITHGSVIREIVLREPTFEEYMAIGDPYEVAQTENNVRYSVQSPEAISQYLDVCLEAPKDRGLLDKQGARLAQRVRAEILNFFQDDAAEGQDSNISPPNSSSPAGSTQAPSTN